MVRDVVEADPTVSLSAPLSRMAQAAQQSQSAEAAQRRAQEEQSQDKLNAVKRLLKPYTFEHTPNSVEMTVIFPVPPDTAVKHVKVTIKAETLKVEVVGHA